MALKRGKPVREKKNSVFILVISFCLFTGAFLFLRSPYFSVKEFVVTGNSVIDTEEILARCGQTHPNIFAFNVDKANELIEGHPWIGKAACKRRLPDTILICVTERFPVAFAPIEGVMWLIDSEGRILGEDLGVGDGLIGLTGIEGQAIPGQFIQDKYRWGLRVLSILGPLSRQKLIEINVQEGDCTLILDDGCVVLFGAESGDSEKKVALLDSILTDLESEGSMAERIDLRYDKQAIKLRFSKAGGG